MRTLLFASLIALPVFAGTARAEDCAPLKEIMLNAAQIPHSATLTRTVNGKPVVTHMVVTADAMYMENRGTWRKGPRMASREMMEENIKTAKLACTRIGGETVNGVATTLWSIHVENQGSISDNRMWLDANNRPVRTETKVEGSSFVTDIDYAHVDPPANAVPLGK